ncbi:VWA domain-containing protein, partial [Patescibacteria group bacterium]
TGPEYGDEDMRNVKMAMPTMDMAMEAESGIGFSVGGAKDINNFRENILANYFPIPTDVTYEGLFYDYYFDTGQEEECKKLFCPSYSSAVSADPFSKNDDYYLSVGLNSNLTESDFQRKKLNLMVVLDISGSMSSAFDSYYYDQLGTGVLEESPEEMEARNKSKMEIANEAVVGLLDHLNDDDRFGMVLFDDYAYLGKPISAVGESDMDKIKEHILEITPEGGTYMEAGMEMGTELFDEFLDVDPEVYENRIIFLTDAMPNIGATDEDSLQGMFVENAENGIYTTFIGIGVDFNTELTEALSKVRGANYYSVHSSSEFMTRMDDEFEYMVTPLVFDLELKLEGEGFEIEKVYGSPEADEATGELMKVNTLFPSKTVDGETRGGLVLLKLKKTAEEGELKLSASYKDRNGVEDSDVREIVFDAEGEEELYANNGIRKGIVLSRYADLLISWMIDEYPEREELYYDDYLYEEEPRIEPFDDEVVEDSDSGPLITMEKGIMCPPPFPPYMLNKWERLSVELAVSDHYKELFKEFKVYLEAEMKILGDDTLESELEVLDILIGS